MLRTAAAAVVLVFSAAACGSSSAGPDNVDEGFEEGEYIISGTPHGNLIGDPGVDTRWSEDLRTIYLGADEVREPLGTLYMTYGDLSLGADGFWSAPLKEALLSTTRVRVGTSAQLDAHVYRRILVDDGYEGSLSRIKLGQKFMAAEVDVFMERISVPIGEVSDTIRMRAVFAALN